MLFPEIVELPESPWPSQIQSFVKLSIEIPEQGIRLILNSKGTVFINSNIFLLRDFSTLININSRRAIPC